MRCAEWSLTSWNGWRRNNNPAVPAQLILALIGARRSAVVALGDVMEPEVLAAL